MNHMGEDGDVIVNYPGAKRHSTGDAAQVEGFSSSMLGQQLMARPTNGKTLKNSTVSLFEPGNQTGRKSASRTTITDF